MKKRKRYTCLTLFSVGLLASQWGFSPRLLAEERQAMDTSLNHSSPTTNEQLDELDHSLMQEDNTTVQLEDMSEYEQDPMEDRTDSIGSGVFIPEELYNDTQDTGASSEEEQLEEIEVEQIPDESDNSEEGGSVDSEKPDEASPAPDEEQTEEQEDIETVDPSDPPEERPGVEEEQIQEPTPQPEGSDNKPVPPVSTTPKEVVPTVVQKPRMTPSLTTGFYDGSASTSLPEVFRASEVSESTLLGFTLPLLSTYEEEWQAALVYGVIRQIGEESEQETIEEWVDTLTSKIIQDGQWLSGQEVNTDDLQPGDLLLSPAGEITGLYLAEGYQVNLEVSQEAFSEESTEAQTLAIQRIPIEESIQVNRMNQASLTDYGQSLITDYPAPYTFTTNQETQGFIVSLAKDAQRLGQEYDVFASVLIAQAILESGSGTSGLARSPHYNLFGIKGSYQGNSVVLPTMEDTGNGDLFEIQAAFRSYGSYNDSMADYVSLIRGGITGNVAFYQEVWRSEAKNYLRATDALTGTYATDVTYNKKLNSLIAAYELTQYDEVSGTETGVFIQGEDQIPAEYRALMTLPAYNGRDYNHSGSYPVGQCTWYVFNRVHQLGGKVDDYMGNGGQWGATGRRLGYTVSQTPKIGSMISFTPGTAGSDPRYGHVAFVEAVGPEGILISEGNVVGGTTISYRVISNELARSSHVSYISPK